MVHLSGDVDVGQIDVVVEGRRASSEAEFGDERGLRGDGSQCGESEDGATEWKCHRSNAQTKQLPLLFFNEVVITETRHNDVMITQKEIENFDVPRSSFTSLPVAVRWRCEPDVTIAACVGRRVCAGRRENEVKTPTTKQQKQF